MYDRNKPHHTLPDLPPSREMFDVEVLMKWGIASRHLAELSKNVFRMPNPYMLINTLSIREAKSSVEIENIFTTDDDLYKAISSTVKEETANASTKEVLNYREGLWGGYRKMEENGRVDLETILTVFQKVKDTDQGFRPAQSQIVIRRGNSDLRPGEVVYTPPRGEGIIEQKIENLIQFLNEDNGFDPLLKMAVAHYQFEAIHPFLDGNGRTGRIINLLYLVNQGLLSHPVLYLSRYIIRHKEDYYHHLSGVTQRNSWKPWLLFMMDAVEQTAKYTNVVVDDILNQQSATLEHTRKSLKWYTAELNELLFSQPYIKQHSMAEVLGISSRTTLVKYAGQLVEAGVLSALRDGKEVYYINNDLMRILD
jgi:Fic family protein